MKVYKPEKTLLVFQQSGGLVCKRIKDAAWDVEQQGMEEHMMWYRVAHVVVTDEKVDRSNL